MFNPFNIFKKNKPKAKPKQSHKQDDLQDVFDHIKEHPDLTADYVGQRLEELITERQQLLNQAKRVAEMYRETGTSEKLTKQMFKTLFLDDLTRLSCNIQRLIDIDTRCL